MSYLPVACGPAEDQRKRKATVIYTFMREEERGSVIFYNNLTVVLETELPVILIALTLCSIIKLCSGYVSLRVTERRVGSLKP